MTTLRGHIKENEQSGGGSRSNASHHQGDDDSAVLKRLRTSDDVDVSLQQAKRQRIGFGSYSPSSHQRLSLLPPRLQGDTFTETVLPRSPLPSVAISKKATPLPKTMVPPTLPPHMRGAAAPVVGAGTLRQAHLYNLHHQQQRQQQSPPSDLVSFLVANSNRNRYQQQAQRRASNVFGRGVEGVHGGFYPAYNPPRPQVFHPQGVVSPPSSSQNLPYPNGIVQRDDEMQVILELLLREEERKKKMLLRHEQDYGAVARTAGLLGRQQPSQSHQFQRQHYGPDRTAWVVNDPYPALTHHRPLPALHMPHEKIPLSHCRPIGLSESFASAKQVPPFKFGVRPNANIKYPLPHNPGMKDEQPVAPILGRAQYHAARVTPPLSSLPNMAAAVPMPCGRKQSMQVSSRTISEPQAQPPRLLPTTLAHANDHLVLSSHQVFLRRHIEVFQATEADTRTHTRGRNKTIQVGQVGIRCIHCANRSVYSTSKKQRRQKGSVYFPSSTMGLYQAAQNMSTTHLQCGLCVDMPEAVKKQFAELIATKPIMGGSLRGRNYWSTTAKELGLVDSDDGSGIRFSPPRGTPR